MFDVIISKNQTKVYSENELSRFDSGEGLNIEN